MPSIEQQLKTEAENLGFLLSGITTPDPPQHFNVFKQWVAAGHHAAMSYLARPDSLAKRKKPSLLLDEVKSILVLGFLYQAIKRTSSEQRGSPSISAYAMGQDYHDLIPKKIQTLMENFQKETGQYFEWKAFTDSAPVMEHDLAVRAGLGWIGKNSLLLNRNTGSYFFLTEVFLTIALTPDEPERADYCGTCTQCIEACPTEAILNNRTLDANRCLSYLTIENKGAVPIEFRGKLTESIFGCDICQQVCPWNQKQFEIEGHNLLFEQDPNLLRIDVQKELLISPQEFNQKFQTSPISRAKRRGYLRNLCVWVGNSGDFSAIPALEALLRSEEDTLIREHAQWALNKLLSAGAGKVR